MHPEIPAAPSCRRAHAPSTPEKPDAHVPENGRKKTQETQNGLIRPTATIVTIRRGFATEPLTASPGDGNQSTAHIAELASLVIDARARRRGKA